MTLLRDSAAGLAALALEGTLGMRIAGQMSFHTGRRPSPAEVQSWDNSLPVLARDLVQAGLDKVEVLVEHHLPLTSQRIDVILAGAHPRTGDPSYVVIELKQWSHARRWKDDPTLLTVPGMGGGPRLHPLLQVQGYCTYLADFARTLEGRPESLAGAAYLHNATAPDVVGELRGVPEDEYGRLFTAADRGDFHEFLRSRLDGRVSGAAHADALIRSAVAPSKQLLAVAADEVQRREQFVLLADQRLAYQIVLRAVEEARAGGQQDRCHRDGRARQREERHRTVVARGAGPTGSNRSPCHGVTIVHADPAEGGGCKGAEGAAHVQVLQPVHGR